MQFEENLDISNLKKAVASLRSGIDTYLLGIDDLTPAQNALQAAGVIQNFEFTYELCWKFMKRWIEMNITKDAADGVTRRELFRMAAENKLIEDVNLWMELHKSRNETSHTYDENVAKRVLEASLGSLGIIDDFLNRLEARI